MTIAWDANRRARRHAAGRDRRGRPLVRLRRVGPDDVELLAKVEWYGPTGSVKDRIYAHMLGEAEARGDLQAGMTIIECTTGNAGIACAAVAAIKGYACVIVMPEGMSAERKTMIRGYGAELVLTPGRGHGHRPRDGDGCARSSRPSPDRYFFPAEFENPDNPEAQRAIGRGDLGADRRAVSMPSSRRRGPADGSAASRAALKAHDPAGPRLRRRAGRVPADLRATVGHARRARHRRRDHPAEPRSVADGRHRHGRPRPRRSTMARRAGARGRACSAARRRA